jgi:predicted permease
MRVIFWVALVSLIAHPAITWTLGTQVFDLTVGQLRAAIVTSAMAPGVNTYVFANMYGAARRVAASSVLICTALSLVTASVWLTLLP